MTTEKLNQWYDFFKDTSERKFATMINNCLIECTFTPTMANLFKGSYNDANNRYRDYTPEY